ncbi:MAG: nuclear transport factor 2 family protein [Flavobacteriales bacterium]|nr:nuclear transport factor 2 family protein [Flavobacteriales bacterium]
MKYIAYILLGLVLVSCGEAEPRPKAGLVNDAKAIIAKESVGPSFSEIITRKMENQQNAWNSGSLDRFMIGYWKSDSLKFIGKSGLNTGWQKTLDNYKKSYPTPDSMGILQFDNISIEQLDVNVGLVIGKWTLFREILGDTLSGHYSLNWQLRDGEWVIIADHSS